MPELPEVETVCNGLRPIMQGQTIVNVRQNRANLRYAFPDNFAKQLTNQQITGISRRAKYINVHLSNGEILIIHLGMSGRMIVEQGDRADAKHEHVVFQLDNGYVIRYNDPRRFGCMDITSDADKYFAKWGPEPFAEEFNAEYLCAQLKKRSGPIKVALLDQSIVAGLGNIYVCEALFKTRINPNRPAKLLTAQEAKILIPEIQSVLKLAIQAGGSTLNDYAQPNGESGYFQHNFAVYGRENKPCTVCAHTIKRIVQGGRSTFYCSSCQLS